MEEETNGKSPYVVRAVADPEEFLQVLSISDPQWGTALESSWVFRGHSRSSWRLRPRAWRLDGNRTLQPLVERYRSACLNRRLRENYPGYELELCSQVAAQLRAISDFARLCDMVGRYIPPNGVIDDNKLLSLMDNVVQQVPPLYPLQVAAYAQHYGVPTALLDWSLDPWIAAYFAAENFMRETNEDIAVWALDCSVVKAKVRDLKIVKVPHYNFEFLHAQNGVLTYYEDGFNRFLQNGFWFCLERVFAEYRGSFGDTIPLRKITLPSRFAKDVIRLLFKHGKTAAHIRPTYEYVAMAVVQKWQLEPDDVGRQGTN